MTNAFYENDPLLNFVSGETAMGADVDAKFDLVEAGFDKLPTESQLKEGTAAFADVTGTNNLAITLPYPWTTFVGRDGSVIVIRTVAANTGAVTLNPDTLGAKSVVRLDGTALQADDFAADAFYSCRYHEVNNKFYAMATEGMLVDIEAARVSAVSDITDEVTYATEWATKAEDLAVSVAAGGDASTTFSSLHHAAKSEASNVSALAAAAVASTASATIVNGTSTTSLTIGIGTKTLTTQTGKEWVAGNTVKIARTSAANTTFMEGTLLSYDAGTGAWSADITFAAGTGTHTDWTVSITTITTTSGVTNIVASGSGSAGDPVVINSDGTFSSISGTAPAVLAARTVFSDSIFLAIASNRFFGMAYDPVDEKILVAYPITSALKMNVGSITGISAAWSTPVTLLAANSYDTRVLYDPPSGNFLTIYGGAASKTYAVACTITGTTPSAGTAVPLEPTNATISHGASYDVADGKHLISYIDTTTGSSGNFVAATVAGTVVTLGTSVEFSTVYSGGAEVGFDYDPVAGKHLFVYSDNSGNQMCTVVTLSSGVITYTTPIATGLNIGATTYSPALSYDVTSGSFLLCYFKAATTNGPFHAATIDIVAGNPVVNVFSETLIGDSSSTTGGLNAIANPVDGGVTIYYKDTANSGYPTMRSVTIAGGSFRVSDPLVIASVAEEYVEMAYDSVNNQMWYGSVGASTYGGVYPTTTGVYNLAADNLIGASPQSFINNDVVPVQLSGSVDANQSGLITGSNYYADSLGVVSKDTGGVAFGKAISATELIVKG